MTTKQTITKAKEIAHSLRAKGFKGHAIVKELRTRGFRSDRTGKAYALSTVYRWFSAAKPRKQATAATKRKKK